MSRPRIAIVIGHSRPTRFADKPAAWLLEKAEGHGEVDAEIVDLRDFDLPFFDAPASDLWMETTDPKAKAWQDKMAEFDGYVFMVAEYNHSITGELKNALDWAYMPFVRKPFSAFGYGGVGAARAVEHLRTIGVELQMAPIRNAVHLGGGEMLKVHPMGQNGDMSEVDAVLAPSAKQMFDDLAWWARTLKSARAEERAEAA
ncbi:NADPH-dependent FMN reductase [Roseisalinus antarcticus]|uniref:FMN-dependent NADPH-azoreductase n=1 Tax=Roseisalinus antarcticus TaxID=254357 RepID=A0A1Y5SIT4_9RHOB|nr:NAD(P)H-dependent oxidoreductase [Roseisalinus antarcticus]SLN40112.1 FMN-dependent NADPH-azoreductase [Roseisalinus antarcticus]